VSRGLTRLFPKEILSIMSVSILSLPVDVVQAIAAGEVIDSPTAAVRELIENALDAGATRITIAVEFDRWQVQVADNGRGMTRENVQRAATAHSTSKIQAWEDLSRITTLGFRGEALHSLARLGELEIFSRVRGAEGWRAIYSHEGEPQQLEAAAIAPGTVVTVTHLFRDWLPRRQSLPSPAQQLRGLQLAIGQLALCHPHVTWQVRQGDRLWFTLSPGATARDILPQIARQIRREDLQHVWLELTEPSVQPSLNPTNNLRDNLDRQSIEVVLGLPDRCHRRRLDWVKVAVNGRCVQLPEVEQTIVAAMARTLPRHRYPVCFVHLHAPPDQIDWNRNPAKTELYLRDLSEWQQQVSCAIEQALHLAPANLPALSSPRVMQLLNAAESKGVYHLDRALPEVQMGDALPASEEGVFGALAGALTAIAQANEMYIVAEHAAGLWLVEQHIAHERVLYEELCDRWQLLPLTPAIVLPLGERQVEQLQRIGVEVDPFGEGLWAVRSAPSLLHGREDCSAALVELSQVEDLQAAQVATACRSAIRNGTPLTLEQMQTLLDRWQRTRSPRTCPHGRPIYLALEETSLARFFRRHWTIGKSHGLRS
jgi:DNA mismatch repair protein MutL